MVYRERRLRREDILIDGERIITVGAGLPNYSVDRVISCPNCLIVPGFVDVHTHLRVPGFFYKETAATATLAAARGGFTTVCAMPNVNPVPDSAEHIRVSRETIDKDAIVNVKLVGAITKGERGEELSDMDAIAGDVVGFSDDGHGVQSDELMRQAMLAAKRHGKSIMAHTEDNRLRGAGVIHQGEYAARHGIPGIPAAAEWRQVERDLNLVHETGARYHVQHVSCKETVELIRKAKAQGTPVTCETAPHYLALSEDDLLDDGRFLMNPPLRSAEDRQALICGLADGTIDIIATDHAPHTDQEKSKGLRGSAMGIVGLETAFSVVYTKLMLTGKVPLERILSAMCDEPRKLIGELSAIRPNASADLTIIETETPIPINAKKFASKGHSSPFDGWAVRGQVLMTMVNGRITHEADALGAYSQYAAVGAK
ncbi:dihydroorotase [Clostridia bacterium]|nr:dihydroorotase [Clostridia bacterium]